jgi:purine nucleosidase
MTTKVLLDTDIGSDIDDAVCLAYLLAHPDCELVGITTVTGQGARRARLASALCRQAGVDVPIRVGAERPLLVRQHQPEAPQAAALDRWPHHAEIPPEPAIDLMRRTIRRHPGEVVLLTIGPLTNVALLFAVDPEIPSLLKGLVSMAGCFGAGPWDGQEWNVALDPHAAAMVYRARPPFHRTVGLDVTIQVTMDPGAVRQRFRSDLLRPVLDFAEVWFEERDRLTFHDPLAAAVLLADGICTFDRGAVKVEIEPRERRGRVRWTPGDPDGHHEVATTVDASAFFDHYFAVVSDGAGAGTGSGVR